MSRGEQDAVHAWLRGRLAPLIACDRRLAELSAAHETLRIADVGCGPGNWLKYFAAAFEGAFLYGVDRDRDRLLLARASVPVAHLVMGDARELPWPDQSFDLVSQFVVFSSVLNTNERAEIAREMLRVLKPAGVILWYDFFAPNPKNVQTRPIRREEIGTLFPNCRITVRRVTLAAPLAHLGLLANERFARALERLPFLRTHYLAIIQRRGV